MQTFVGIDVGATKLFGASIRYDEGGNSQIAFPSSVVPAEVCAWTSGLSPEAIGIDSPSGTSLDRAGRRDVERQLGIGGCYATPFTEESMAPWMRQGLATYRRVATALGASDSLHDGSGRLFETHPTYAFKSLIGVRDAEGRIMCDPDGRLLPKRPRRKGGHAQRVQLLAHLASHFGISIEPHIDRLKNDIDDTDALLAAFMGLLRSKGLTRSIGNPREGTVSIACLDHDHPLRVACQGGIAELAQAAVEAGVEQRQAAMMGSGQAADGSQGYALALGPSGPGGMSPQQTLASLFGPWSVDGRGYFPTTFHPGLIGGKELLVGEASPLGVVLLMRDEAPGAQWKLVAQLNVVGRSDSSQVQRSDLFGERDPWPAEIDSHVQWLEFDDVHALSVSASDAIETWRDARKEWEVGLPEGHGGLRTRFRWRAGVNTMRPP